MRETCVERAQRPFLPATAAGKGLGDLPLGSPQSKAAARLLLASRQRIEAEDDEWDKEPDSRKIDIAGILAAARERAHARWRNGEVSEASPQAWAHPIPIPPGKEYTVRGRKIAELNAARARMARFEAEVRAEATQNPARIATKEDGQNA